MDSHFEDVSSQQPDSFRTIGVSAVIIGSGISGLFTALKLADSGLSVLIVTKTSLSENNSRYAQGGIAAVLPNNLEDSLDLHVQDTLSAGAGLCDEPMVRAILADGYTAIADLLTMGVPFDLHQDGELSVTLEGGHSVRRIIHAGGDATGQQVEMTLLGKVHTHPNIQVLEFCEVSELLTEDNRCIGCRAVLYKDSCELVIEAQYTILATGGLGRLFAQSTNPEGSTGNGFALAYAAGATLKDMEFVQFHPTAFIHQGQARFLVSEAVRGEGGVLRNAAGEAFAKSYTPQGELAPRDVVSRAIFSEIQAQASQHDALPNPLPHVWLDVTHLPASTIETRFPNILQACQAYGVDPRTDWIPVAPAAHYMMGGVAVDLNGQSDVANLFIVGETVWTGLHGANRLASNSLLECLVLARNTALKIAENHPKTADTNPPRKAEATGYRFETPPALSHALDTLHQTMWQHVSLLRSADGLTEAIKTLNTLSEEAKVARYALYAPLGIDYANQLVVAQLITQAALARQESRGAHTRTDFPETLRMATHSQQRLHAKKTPVSV